MLDDNCLVERIEFDEERHCLIPANIGAYEQPITIQDKLKRFEQIVKSTQRGIESLVDLTCLVVKPVVVPIPKFDIPPSGATQKPIIVMGPTSGHTPTIYDLFSSQDQAIAISNQILAVGWEATRQALLRLGANVVIANDIYGEVGIDVMEASHGTMQPVQQIFTRDSGVIVGSDYLVASEDSIYEMSMNALRSAHGLSMGIHPRAEKLAQLTAGLKPRHGLNVARAFNEAGQALTVKTIDAFFEGGDVFVDHQKNIILVGDDDISNRKTYGLAENNKSLRQEFARHTGMSPVIVERPYTAVGKGRQDGERFHLDCFMALLPQGELLIDPRFTTPRTLEMLKGLYGSNLIIIDADNKPTTQGPAGAGEVPNYTANLVTVGNSILMPTCSPSLKTTLQGRGYAVITAADLGVPPGLFYMRGGGMHCATQSGPSLGA